MGLISNIPHGMDMTKMLDFFIAQGAVKEVYLAEMESPTSKRLGISTKIVDCNGQCYVVTEEWVGTSRVVVKGPFDTGLVTAGLDELAKMKLACQLQGAGGKKMINTVSSKGKHMEVHLVPSTGSSFSTTLSPSNYAATWNEHNSDATELYKIGIRFKEFANK